MTCALTSSGQRRPKKPHDCNGVPSRRRFALFRHHFAPGSHGGLFLFRVSAALTNRLMPPPHKEKKIAGQITIALSDSEMQALEVAAHMTGTTKTEYCRNLIVADAHAWVEKVKVAKDYPAVKEQSDTA
jgi:hypothetical protein